MSHRDKQPQKLIVEAVIDSKEDDWSESTQETARSDAQRILESLVSVHGVDNAIEAMNKQGFEGKAYRYLLRPMYEEARSRRTRKSVADDG